MKDATLVLLFKGNPISKVLLGFKKIGFGQGKFTGIGGKIEPGEGVAEAALRELTEETGVTVPHHRFLENLAIIEFHFPHKPTWDHRVYVFATHHWEGTPAESDEIIPQWFKVEEIPYLQMWDDSSYWLPKILTGEKFQAKFKFNADNATVKKAEFKTELKT